MGTWCAKERLHPVRALLLGGAATLPFRYASDGTHRGAAHGIGAHATEIRLLEVHLRLPCQVHNKRLNVLYSKYFTNDVM